MDGKDMSMVTCSRLSYRIARGLANFGHYPRGESRDPVRQRSDRLACVFGISRAGGRLVSDQSTQRSGREQVPFLDAFDCSCCGFTAAAPMVANIRPHMEEACARGYVSTPRCLLARVRALLRCRQVQPFQRDPVDDLLVYPAPPTGGTTGKQGVIASGRTIETMTALT